MGGSFRMSTGGMIVPFQVSHPPDEDHVLEVPAPDKKW